MNRQEPKNYFECCTEADAIYNFSDWVCRWKNSEAFT